MKKKTNKIITDRVIAILSEQKKILNQNKAKQLLTSPNHTLNLQSCAYFLLLEKGTTSVLTNSNVIPLKFLYGEGQKPLSYFTRK